jgi:sec-independent protein translocase protein TatC
LEILELRTAQSHARYMIVIHLILGALLTTPEVFTQVVMAIVLQVLYEISVGLRGIGIAQERKREQKRARSPCELWGRLVRAPQTETESSKSEVCH